MRPFIANDDDYHMGLSIGVISPGIKVTKFIINITDDNILETEETFNVSLVFPKTLTTKGFFPTNISSVVITIMDTDG